MFHVWLLYGRHSMEMQKMIGFGIKDCLTEASLEWKCLGKDIKDREFQLFNNKYERDFLRRSIEGSNCAALNR